MIFPSPVFFATGPDTDTPDRNKRGGREAFLHGRCFLLCFCSILAYPGEPAPAALSFFRYPGESYPARRFYARSAQFPPVRSRLSSLIMSSSRMLNLNTTRLEACLSSAPFLSRIRSDSERLETVSILSSSAL